MTSPVYYRVAVAAPLRRFFDYLPPPGQDSAPTPGVRVRVPFGAKTVIALLVEIHSDTPAFELRAAEAVLDDQPLLDRQLLKLLLWASQYYCHPAGEVFSTALPSNLRKGRAAIRHQRQHWRAVISAGTAAMTVLNNAPKQKAVYEFISHEPDGQDDKSLSGAFSGWRPIIKALIQKGLIEPYIDKKHSSTCPTDSTKFELAPQQQSAIDTVNASFARFNSFLLHGVTGSGKTEVYLQITQNVIEQGRQVLILVPEIGLTPQLLSRFTRRFQAPIALLHSGLNDSERQEAWLSSMQGDSQIIIGTRSAIFTPMKSPGLIIIDEEHDSSFKQMDGFRYSARDLAIKRASLLNIPIVLGSATPSLESFNNVALGKSEILSLPDRAGTASAPSIYRLDMRGKKINHGLSPHAIKAIEDEITSGGQALLFLNRRGFAPTLVCADCGWISKCHHCDVRMTVHRSAGRLRCHVCSHEALLPVSCPECNSGKLIPLGQGTERLEQFLSELFPQAGVVRVDRDTTRKKGALQNIIQSIRSGEKKILIGTQILAKGHHFPQVGTVIIMDADSGLFGLDFHAQERMAQLITQVSGRAGRASRHGKVYIQSYHPEHPFFEALEKYPYEQFAESMLRERAVTSMPPYSFLALLRVESGKMAHVERFIDRSAEIGLSVQQPGMEFMGPAIAPLERKAGRFHMQLLVRSDNRRALQIFLDQWVKNLDEIKGARQVRWSVDMDPYDLY